MHLSKEEIHQDTKRPQEHIIHPVRHGMQFLVQRLADALGRLNALLLLPFILFFFRGLGLAESSDVVSGVSFRHFVCVIIVML